MLRHREANDVAILTSSGFSTLQTATSKKHAFVILSSQKNLNHCIFERNKFEKPRYQKSAHTRFAVGFAGHFAAAKSSANLEIEIESEIEYENI